MQSGSPHATSSSSSQNGVHHASVGTFSPSAVLKDRRFVVVGGTGFLGKVWLAFLLDRFPEVGHLYLLVRAKAKQTPEERFWSQIASSPVFDPLRARYTGEAFEAFLRQKITPVDGDVARDTLGIDPGLVDKLRGNIDAVVNVAGVVDFNPPLDEALEVNAFGVSNIASLAKVLGAKIMHTSTCYVAGYRSGLVEEVDPRVIPFPRAAGALALGEVQPEGRTLDRSHWDPEGEISECLDLVKQARQRCDDAFRQSAFLDQAKKSLETRGEPCRGEALEDEIQKVKRKFIEKQLIAAGDERARFWGFSNIYTYTKSIGEQVLANSGVPFTIVRPAVIESSIEFPFPGWNEGINTSAPFIYLAMKGTVRFPGDRNINLDIIPVDMVSAGMVASLAELVAGTAPAVYQYGVTDTNGCSMARYLELIGLYKRQKVFQGKTTDPLGLVLAQFESMGVTKRDYERIGPHQYASAMKGMSKALNAASIGPLAKIFKPVARSLQSVAKLEERTAGIMDIFVPFTAESDWIFSCANTRAAMSAMTPEDRAKFIWYPESIDWRAWMYDVHLPGLEKWVLPEIDVRMNRELKPIRAYDHLLDLIDEVAERHEHAVALQELTDEGLTRTTYQELRNHSFHVADRLATRGIAPGDKVVVSGRNSPNWPIAYFGILRAGAIAVPVDPGLEPSQLANIVKSSNARAALWDEAVEAKSGAAMRHAFPYLEVFDLETLEDTLPGDLTSAMERFAKHRVPPTIPDDVASIIYTSGTTGDPKGVMLMHRNFTGLLASLAPIFPLTHRDHVLSVLPLHHTFEFTCGLLLPLMLGARTIYLAELNADGLRDGFKRGRVTAMAGVPALWQMLERRIMSQVRERGPMAMRAFDAALELNRLIGKQTGLNAGRLLFGTVHAELGGGIRHLISGGAALPKDTAKLFSGLGLPLSEGYGLTEASPVLTVAKAGGKPSFGHVGKPVPGVEIRIGNPDEAGVGEVLARGPNVMKGYEGNVDATNAAIDSDGWLHTGDLGKLDKRGRLVIVGRHKEVIVGKSGENVYPDDVEALIGEVSGIREISIVGLPDGEGGERVACLAVPDKSEEEEESHARSERHRRALAALKASFEALPRVAKPSVVQLYDADLPRTATRKVKRTEVRDILERLVNATSLPPVSEGFGSQARHVIAAIANKNPRDLQSAMTLRGDLGIDSLLAVELTVALETQIGHPLDAKELALCETIGDIEALVKRAGRAPIASYAIEEEAEEAEPLRLPEPIADGAKKVMARFQRGFYDRMMRPEVFGRAHIPHNRNTIVASNHASHLDMGFVKYALGKYGEDIVALAAQDYFFAGDSLRRFYIENLTNLAPFDRKGGLRQALRVAGDHLEQGRTILLFPEGTRSPDGAISEFKPAIGHLALSHRVDILPVYVGGTYEAMRKGTKIPTRRDITARIGKPLAVRELDRLTEGLKFPAACRRVAELCEQAVRALKEGRVLDLREIETGERGELTLPDATREHPLAKLFRDLEARFQPHRVEKPITFYFTLGGEVDEKWTLSVAKDGCRAVRGKPEGAQADCVLKTTPEIFTKIVKEAYVPSPMEFITGQIKSNDVSLLQTFQKVFDLS